MIADSTDINSRYQQGRAAHRAGDLDTAAGHYEQVLSADPRHAESLHFLGNIRARRGEFDEAESAIRSAIEIDARGTGYHNSLGDVLAARHRIDEAQAAYERELAIRPDFAVSHNQLGSLYLNQGKVDPAIECFQAAIRFAPEFAVAANNLGRALNKARRYEDAAAAFRHAIHLSPGMAQAHANLGHIAHVVGDAEEAEREFGIALELDETLPAANRGLGLLFASRGHTRAAVEHFRQALESNPRDSRTLRALGDVYLNEGLFEQACTRYEQALRASPDDPDLLCAAAAARRSAGDADKALEHYRRALALRASHQTALAGLATLVAENGDPKSAVARLAPSINSGRASPELLGTYATLLGQLGRRREGIALLEGALQKTLEEKTAAQLHFALADLLDGDASYDLAFYHCRRGNSMSHVRYDVPGFEEQIIRIARAHSKAALAELPQLARSEQTPIFVVGMPRSGLAVLKSVLCVNPRIRDLGSSPRVEMCIHALWRHAGASWPDPPRGLSVEALTRVAQRTIAERGARAAGEAFFLDATWRNYLYLGVIEKLFPGAKIVECVRDARDTALSCYFRSFTAGGGLPFSYDLANIAAVVNSYRKLMSHWRTTLASPIHTVEYESLILETDTTCERLAEFLDIPWEPEQFGIADSAAANTHGKDSWRLRAKSLRRYRHYRQHLETFVEALDAPPGEHR